MAQVVLEQALELIKELDTSELHRVEQVVRERLDCPREARGVEELHENLLRQGLVTRIKTPPQVARKRRPVLIQGQPLSETIIEDRR